jgi:hypothetical protein
MDRQWCIKRQWLGDRGGGGRVREKKLMEPPPFLKNENRFHPRRTNGNAIKKRSW